MLFVVLALILAGAASAAENMLPLYAASNMAAMRKSFICFERVVMLSTLSYRGRDMKSEKMREMEADESWYVCGQFARTLNLTLWCCW